MQQNPNRTMTLSKGERAREGGWYIMVFVYRCCMTSKAKVASKWEANHMLIDVVDVLYIWLGQCQGWFHVRKP